MNTLNDTGWWSRFYERWFAGSKRLDKGSITAPLLANQAIPAVR